MRDWYGGGGEGLQPRTEGQERHLSKDRSGKSVPGSGNTHCADPSARREGTGK